MDAFAPSRNPYEHLNSIDPGDMSPAQQAELIAKNLSRDESTAKDKKANMVKKKQPKAAAKGSSGKGSTPKQRGGVSNGYVNKSAGAPKNGGYYGGPSNGYANSRAGAPANGGSYGGASNGYVNKRAGPPRNGGYYGGRRGQHGGEDVARQKDHGGANGRQQPAGRGAQGAAASAAAVRVSASPPSLDDLKLFPDLTPVAAGAQGRGLRS